VGKLLRCDSNAYTHSIAYSHTRGVAHRNRYCNADFYAFTDS
jgi:hypothetical protein